MVANIKPEWLEELGSHLCRYSYSEPHWEKKQGQVVAYEQVKLYGLTIVDRRKVNYSGIRPAEAREIFIRSALVQGEFPGNFGFLEHNRELIQRIEEMESKTRRRDLLVDDEVIYRFYDERLPEIADLRSFNKFLKNQGNDDLLRMTEGDLLRTIPDFDELEQFPDTLHVEDLQFPLRYTFHPGHEEDGVTVTIPIHALPKVDSQPFEWLVPGMLLEKVTELLKALPKSLRKQLVPVGYTAQQVTQRLPFRKGHLYSHMSTLIWEMTGVRVPVQQWNREDLKDHLRMRFEVVSSEGRVLGAGRNLEELKSLAMERHEDRVWKEARRTWEKEGLTSWSFGDLPQKIDLGKDAFGVTRYAYPGIVAESHTWESVTIRLFEDPHEAKTVNRFGLMLLYQLTFGTALKYAKKDWVFPKNMALMIFFMGNPKEANKQLQDYLMRELFHLHDPLWPDRKQFEDNIQRLKGKLALLGWERMEEVFRVVKERHQTRMRIEQFRKMAASNPGTADHLKNLLSDLEVLVSPDFLSHYRRAHIQQLPRYLEALRIRAERAYAAPEKDRLKAEKLLPHQARYEALKEETLGDPSDENLQLLDELRWLLEEFKISLFAPEIKTRYPISAKRLEKKWEERFSRKKERIS
jgi:ATP-dependent helicase HrpA